MQAGDADQTPAAGEPTPSGSPRPASADLHGHAGTPPGDEPTPPAGVEPVLPGATPGRQGTTGPAEAPAKHRSPTWYRSTHERDRSVRRRANPWYRRFGRYLVAATFLTALAIGLYFGARLLQDWIDRDRLPAAGAEVPEIRETSFLVRAGSPAPEIDGTLTIDATSGAFEFEGRNGGPQTGVEVVSPDGATTYIRTLDGEWAELVDEAPGIRRVDLLDVVRYLRDDENADAILTNRLRRGYVDLVDRETEGTGAEQLRRYELELNTRGFSSDYPLQWQAFRDGAIPGVSEERKLPVVIWLDTEDVLVRVRDERTNWSWERLSYSNVPFTPAGPAGEASSDDTDGTG